MKFYINTPQKDIPYDRPSSITVEEALREIDAFPTIEEFEEGFIGFENDRGETIQFLRLEKDKWLIDMPLPEEKASLQGETTTTQTKTIIKIVS
ncbi:MAG: hypothetical protein DRO43_03880 [Candidatus Hecatellales archaeon]|nr:MAG: hypothetical protein DRO43_03880 [Candidatus Hecatellales archaeon]